MIVYLSIINNVVNHLKHIDKLQKKVVIEAE